MRWELGPVCLTDVGKLVVVLSGGGTGVGERSLTHALCAAVNWSTTASGIHNIRDYLSNFHLLGKIQVTTKRKYALYPTTQGNKCICAPLSLSPSLTSTAH